MNKQSLTVMGATFKASKGAVEELDAFRIRTMEREVQTYNGYVHDIESSLHDLLYSYNKKDRREISKVDLRVILNKLDSSEEQLKTNSTKYAKIKLFVKRHWRLFITLIWVVCAIISVILFTISVNELPLGHNGENPWYYGIPIEHAVVEPAAREEVRALQLKNFVFYSSLITLFTFAAFINYRSIRYLRWRIISNTINFFIIFVLLFVNIWLSIDYKSSQFLDKSTIEQEYASSGLGPLSEKLSICGTSLEVSYGVDNYFDVIRGGATKQQQYAYDNVNAEPLFSEQLCKDYFKLLEKYDNDQIIAMYFIVNESGQEYPVTNQLGNENAKAPFSSKKLIEDTKRSFLGLYIK